MCVYNSWYSQDFKNEIPCILSVQDLPVYVVRILLVMQSHLPYNTNVFVITEQHKAVIRVPTSHPMLNESVVVQE